MEKCKEIVDARIKSNPARQLEHSLCNLCRLRAVNMERCSALNRTERGSAGSMQSVAVLIEFDPALPRSVLLDTR
jgi:hypothetical protein